MNYLIIASICFALTFGLIKSQLASLPSDAVIEIRLFFAALAFLPFLAKTNGKFFDKMRLKAALIGTVQFGIMYSCTLRAFKYLQGNEVALLSTSTPMLVMICATILGEKFNWKYLFCVLLSILGAIIVIYKNVSFDFLLKGVLLMEMANFCFALGQVLWRKYIGGEESKLMSTTYLAASLFLLPFAIFNKSFSGITITTNQWLSLLYIGVITTGIGFWLWNKGAKLVSSTTLAVMNNLKIPLGVLFAILIFSEKINIANFIVGSTLILSATVISNKKFKAPNK